MRGLSKQNFSKSSEVCRFLKEPVDLEKVGKHAWSDKKKFMINTINFRLPINLDYKKKASLLKDVKLMKNLFIQKLEVIKSFPYDFITANPDKLYGLQELKLK